MLSCPTCGSLVASAQLEAGAVAHDANMGPGPRTWRELWRELPLELQDSVWRLALGGPRVHRLRYRLDHDRLELVPSETLPRSTQAARSVLAVSRGARESALRMLSGKISFADRGILRFNAKRDTVSVVGLNYGTMNTVADQAIKCPSITCIRNLGIEIRNTSFRSDFPRHFSDRLDYLFRFLLRFRSLETLSLVTMPMPGDPDTVKFVRVIETEEDDEIPISLLDRDLYEIMPDDSGLPRWAGELVRGENGLSDWYCRTPTDARWGYVDRTEITHLDEVLEWRDAIESYGRSAVVSWGESGTSEKLKSLVKSLDVQVMTHFREGVEPPEF